MGRYFTNLLKVSQLFKSLHLGVKLKVSTPVMSVIILHCTGKL